MEDILVIIETTTNNEEKANEIASKLIEMKLAGCIQISKINSHYKYDNKLCNDEEYLIRIKSTKSYFKNVEQVLLDIHNYELPEIICYECVYASKKYKEFINNSLI
ncbi:hypothetical protein H312_00238 [Anncaliia algerae PRA339]|uniref:Divalent-cation tolerance protein CutA n=1 Tax=Anncaliia algerae PRA339 TaxID=1288291 RepID=A0A059F4U0_9MICR|nr:hypothetical protein H312_00238 [Anncaliia algerae PRA339]